MSQPKLTKIMVFGTFDMVHKGHIHFFKQARKLAVNPFLIVSVALDKNVLRIKGRRPKNNQWARRHSLLEVAGIDKVVMGGARDFIPHILKESPDIIALGYDQIAYTESLSDLLKSAGLKTKVVRLKAHKPKLYKTSLLAKNLKAY